MATELPTVSEPERAERCEACKWWERHKFNELGRCHRYPPDYSRITAQPETNNSDWCGEWRAK